MAQLLPDRDQRRRWRRANACANLASLTPQTRR